MHMAIIKEFLYSQQEQIFSAHSPADIAIECEFIILSISLPLVLPFSVGVASEGFTRQIFAQ